MTDPPWYFRPMILKNLKKIQDSVVTLRALLTISLRFLRYLLWKVCNPAFFTASQCSHVAMSPLCPFTLCSHYVHAISHSSTLFHAIFYGGEGAPFTFAIFARFCQRFLQILRSLRFLLSGTRKTHAGHTEKTHETRHEITEAHGNTCVFFPSFFYSFYSQFSISKCGPTCYESSRGSATQKNVLV